MKSLFLIRDGAGLTRGVFDDLLTAVQACIEHKPATIETDDRPNHENEYLKAKDRIKEFGIYRILVQGSHSVDLWTIKQVERNVIY